ncbi:MAG: phosphopyruvate hydratase [Candidatus Moranbacteria bacterium]|nr:phosphopyruvate hydratase [Candidatus Moranbacteria bacterium]
MSKIKKIQAREILDSRGNPTIEVEIELDNGEIGVAAVPSGASTGTFEAVELRDGDKSRYQGKGVRQAVENVNTEIFKSLKGMPAGDQEKIDKAMIELDGRENKSRLGANAILGVSLAVCRAAAQSEKVPLYEYINKISNPKNLFGGKDSVGKQKLKLPIPMFNVLNGGRHSDSGLSIQEFLIIPTGIKSFSEQLRAGSEIFWNLKDLLGRGDYSIGVGDEGGFAPRLESNSQALEFITRAVKESEYLLGAHIVLGLDAAATSFYQREDNQYVLKPEGVSLGREGLVNLYREFIDKYYVVSIEDGLQEEDWDGWAYLMERVGQKPLFQGIQRSILKEHMIIGDDLLVTNIKRLKRAIAEKACNSALIKVNQIGTLSETLSCIELARKNKMKIIISHRSGETTDDFIADLAVGAGADFIKSGSLSRGERIVKYNRLLKIEEDLLDK